MVTKQTFDGSSSKENLKAVEALVEGLFKTAQLEEADEGFATAQLEDVEGFGKKLREEVAVC